LLIFESSHIKPPPFFKPFPKIILKMRFSTFALVALPLLAVAEHVESPLDQFKAQAQVYFDKVQAFLPNPNKHDPVAAAAAKVAGSNYDVLTVDNWESVLRGSSTSEGPEEWWVLVSGRNKTCFGRCAGVEKAFNESAVLFAAEPSAPHLAYLNCDDQPILCNSWAAGPPSLWIFEVAAPPAPIDIHLVGLNTTSTTAKTFSDLHETKSWKLKPKFDGYFHPFDGPIAQAGIAKPLGYVIWVFALIPSWMFMIGVSFFSRTMM
jgi:hypothetical protein